MNSLTQEELDYISNVIMESLDEFKMKYGNDITIDEIVDMVIEIEDRDLVKDYINTRDYK